jgi:hypothetical protein
LKGFRLPEVVLVAAYDSQLKWAMNLARAFGSVGWRHTVLVASDVRHSLSHDQRATADGTPVVLLPWDDLVVRARSADCVVLAVQGPLVARFTDELAVLRSTSPSVREPVVVTGWVGLIIEKLAAGYLDRVASDVVAVNSVDNLRDFEQVARELDLPCGNLLLSGLPLLPAEPAPTATGPVRTVLFADQPTIPATLWDRAYLYLRLMDYARAHPQRRVLLKPRHRPDEGTFHVMQDHPESVLARLGPLPPNLEVTYDNITELLPTIDLMLTVSSTAGLEAIGQGVRTVFVGDLGIHEKHGNQVLLRSGLIAGFDDVIADRLPQPNQDWLDDVFIGHGAGPAARIVDRVVELAGMPPDQRPGQAVAESSYLQGRIAVRSRREQLPAIARDPSGTAGTGGRRLVSILMPFAVRAELLLRALLPGAWYRSALGLWRRLGVA